MALPRQWFFLPIKITLTFVCLGHVCGFTFPKGSRSAPQRISLALVGLLIGLTIPIYILIVPHPLRTAWEFIVACGLVIILMVVIPFFITPVAGCQVYTKEGCYFFILSPFALKQHEHLGHQY